MNTRAPHIVRTNFRQQASDGGATFPERWARIQQRAYAIAQQRGFSPGAELDDWLQAEAEIDAATREGLPEMQR